MPKIVLADIRGRDGFVNKDTIVGGYGARLKGFTKTTRLIELLRKIYQNVPSIQMGYLAAIFARAGHTVVSTNKALVDGNLALVLTSIVDYRNEIEWAQQAKRKFGMKIGFIGTMATHVPQPFLSTGDFVIKGEPEHAAIRLANGETLSGLVESPFIQDLDSLPFPRWDLLQSRRFAYSRGRSLLPVRAAFPILSSRSCPEFCTYCPHRITASYRARTAENVVAEIEEICRNYGRSYLIFRDPLFSVDKERSMAIAQGIITKKLPVIFECETRLDCLDTDLLDLLYEAGLRAMTFGIESVDPTTLKKAGRRPIPPEHQRKVISYCQQKGIATEGFYVLGFPPDTIESIYATIKYAIDLNTTMALFKILTPYPGTPLRKQMESRIFETDLEKFDGFTPTFHHPNLTPQHLRSLLGAAYARYYFRPSWGWNYLGLTRFNKLFHRWIESADKYTQRKQDENEAHLLMPERAST